MTGQVTSEGGAPLPAVQVFIPSLGTGAQTREDGRFSFVVSGRGVGQTVNVTARRIGYEAQSRQVVLTGATVSVDFRMTPAVAQLTGVVVTALGITREKSTLGTAQQQISSAELNQTRALSVVEQLQGKVSGVQITGAGTQGGSANIVIRGANSITGVNQPLFVVDGLPISNDGRGGSPSGGYDYGSTIADINPDNIETVSVLKGPNAAALYGSRAANGVIVITTKKGSNTQGRVRTEVNSYYTFDRPSIVYDFQNQYGQGAEGDFSFVDGAGGGVNDGADQSWGPKLDGRLIDQFTGKKQPWVAQPNNLKDFYATGHTASGTIGVSGGTDRMTARLAIGGENTQGIIPNSFFRKTSGSLTGSMRLSDQWSTNATLQYVRNSAVNRPGTGYNVGILEQFIWFGRQIDINALKDWRQGGQLNGGPSDREYNWNYNYHNNPWYLMEANPLADTRDRFIGQAGITYKPVEWVNATLRTGSDIYRFNIDQRFAQGNLNFADPAYFGGFTFINDYNNENNTELLVTASHSLLSRLALNATVGGNVRKNFFSTGSVGTNGISAPGIFNPSNAAIAPTTTSSLSRRQVNSAFGSAALTFNEWLTVEGTARNDWSSTLPQGNNSYFYPSVNTSVVLTDALPGIQRGGLSFLKLRGSWAQVGSDAGAYKLRATYAGDPNKFNGLPQFTFGNAIPNPNLKPEITTSSEGGVEAAFFQGRLTLDGSLYFKSTKDQIFDVPISPTSGFTSKTINAGRIDNHGVEALLTVVPVQATNGFRWSATFNYTRNRSKVIELSPGVTNARLGRTWSTNLEAREGEPYGAIFGYSFLRDSATQQVMVSGGLTQRGPLKVLGNVQPKWVGSLLNQLQFRNLSLNLVLDTRQGGNLFSVTNMWSDYAGVSKHSLQGREQDWDKPGYTVQGISRQSCGAGSHTGTDGSYVCVGGKPNTTQVTAEQYFQGIYPVVEPFIYDASWLKLRELRIGYDLPSRLANRLSAQGVSIAVTGRNLATWTDVPMIDPEFSYTIGNYQGFEFGALPNARSIGFSVRITP